MSGGLQLLAMVLPEGMLHPQRSAEPLVSDEDRERLCDRAPVFIGHYWMNGPRTPQSSKVACCDYSVPRSGRMVAYRWDGERELVAGKFVESS